MKSTKYPAILILTLTMLASGCSETPFSPPGGQLPLPPGNSGPTKFGLVEVTISGIGTESMTAYSRPARRNVAFDLSAPSNNAALSLDGNGDYVTADGVSDDLVAASAFTIEAWVYPGAASGGQQALFGFHTAGGDNRNILFYNPDTDQFTYYDPTNSFVPATGAYNPGQWYHIALTIDGSNNGILYINGQPKASFTTTARPETDGLFSIGQEYDNGPSTSNFFSGQIDEVRVWNTIRSQAEIQTDMSSQIPPATAGLVSYYRFNEGSGTTTEDLAGDNDGSIHGDVEWGSGPALTGMPPSEGTIQLEAVSNGSFTYGERGGGGVRYLYATFKVRNADISGNAYPTPRHNLTFIAVDTDNSVAAGATFGVTAISKLALYEGTVLTGVEAETISNQTIPTGAVAFRNFDETISTQFPDVLQVFSETAVDAITVLTGVEALPYGFITRSPSVTPGSRNLPAGPAANQFDGVVTFAFKMPLQAQANEDPFEITALFLPIDDSQTRITQSLEEQSPDGNAALAGRANELNPDVITLLPGSTYTGPGFKQFLCTPVRVAGPQGFPAATLFPEPLAFNALMPDPYAANGSAGHIPATSDFKVTFTDVISGVNPQTFVVRSFQSGKQFIGQTYSGNGTPAITTPTAGFFPGEIVELSVTNALGLCPSNRVVRYRVGATAGDGDFGTVSDTTHYAMGSDVTSVTLGDLNGDGALDMVSVNLVADSVYIRLGQGNGTFGSKSAYSVGEDPVLAALGDLDDDGDLDMVVTNSFFTDNNVSVLLGAGDGTFPTETTYSMGAGPRSVALGDLNGDGALDIVTADHTSDNISIRLGFGDGTFLSQYTYAMGNSPFSVALGDLNADGALDIVTVSFNSGVSVRLGFGDGTFGNETTYPAGTSPISVALGDLNSDGVLDIATANFNSENMSVLLGAGDGTFPTKTNYTTGSDPRSVALGDLNADSNLDIVVGNFDNDNVNIFLGDGSGSFPASTSYVMGDGVYWVTLGDLNNNNALDIVTANAFSDSVSVRLD